MSVRTRTFFLIAACWGAIVPAATLSPQTPPPASEPATEEDVRAELKRLKARVQDLEDQRVSEEEESEKKSLKISGFMDSSAVYIKPGGPLSSYLRSNGGFEQTGLHLYFDGNYENTYRAFAEVVFLPAGQFNVYKDAYTDPATGQPAVASRPLPKYGLGFDADPRSPGAFHVDRAFFDYSPFDFLKLRLGKFLTPYGIWNLDHGSLVMTSIRPPIINYDVNSLGAPMVPNYQTGLQLFGNTEIFKTQVSYAIYAANSMNESPDAPQFSQQRNPLAGGAYLNLDFPTWRMVRVQLGGSYYKGTDRQTIEAKSTIVASVYDSGFTFRSYTPDIQTTRADLMIMALRGDTAALNAFFQSALAAGTANTRVNLYDVENRVGAAHAKIAIGAFQIQAEYMYGWIKVNDPGVRSMNRQQSMFGLDPFNENLYDHDYNREAWYVSMQYKIADRVTPYYRYERLTPSTLARDYYTNVHVLGINFKPRPFLVLKLEAYHLEPTDHRSNVPIILQDGTSYKFDYFKAQVSLAF